MTENEVAETVPSQDTVNADSAQENADEIQKTGEQTASTEKQQVNKGSK